MCLNQIVEGITIYGEEMTIHAIVLKKQKRRKRDWLTFFYNLCFPKKNERDIRPSGTREQQKRV